MSLEDQLRSAATNNLAQTSKQVNIEQALNKVTDSRSDGPSAGRFSRPILVVAMAAAVVMIGLGTLTALRSGNQPDSLTADQTNVEGEEMPTADTKPVDDVATETTFSEPDEDVEILEDDHSVTTGPDVSSDEAVPGETEITAPSIEDIPTDVTAPGSGSEVCGSYRLLLTIESERAQSVALDADALVSINSRRNAVLTDIELDNAAYVNIGSVDAAVAGLFAKQINANNQPGPEIAGHMAALKSWYEPGCVDGK